ncbi:hypothetical protein ACL1E6_10135, partial [Corynebacterium striatum]
TKKANSRADSVGPAPVPTTRNPAVPGLRNTGTQNPHLTPLVLTITSAVTIGITLQSTKTTTNGYSQFSAVDIERSRAHSAAILPALSFWFLH